MLFPNPPRTIYARNPLYQVICQLRFPRILLIDKEPADFQERFRKQYPIFREPQRARINLPDEIVEFLSPTAIKTLSLTNKRAYDFLTADEIWTVGLTSEFLSLSSSDYERWENFKAHLEGPLQALLDIYEPAFFSRVGLRYQNLIRRSVLGISEPWSELLMPYISGVLDLANINEEMLEEHRQVIALTLPNSDGSVRMQSGLVRIENDEICFLIDNDFYTQERIEVSDALDRLDNFNQIARRVFRWCITDRLHEALGPQLVRD